MMRSRRQSTHTYAAVEAKQKSVRAYQAKGTVDSQCGLCSDAASARASQGTRRRSHERGKESIQRKNVHLHVRIEVEVTRVHTHDGQAPRLIRKVHPNLHATMETTRKQAMETAAAAAAAAMFMAGAAAAVAMTATAAATAAVVAAVSTAVTTRVTYGDTAATAVASLKTGDSERPVDDKPLDVQPQSEICFTTPIKRYAAGNGKEGLSACAKLGRAWPPMLRTQL
eukprot:6183243-Pleurochrysis_carterae.AAC.3